MFFGDLPIDEAEGALIAHSYKSDQGRIRKGQILTSSLLALLRADGVSHVMAARLSAEDTHEDLAAMAIATALSGDNTRLGSASTGRVNIHAVCDGLLDFASENIHAINRVHESITVATLLPSARVVAGQIVATVKIIPYATSTQCLDNAITRTLTPLTVHSFQASTACLIQTRLPALKESVLDKTKNATQRRLLERHATLVNEQRIEHSLNGVTEALHNTQDKHPDWILVFGASAISDRNDVVPAAIVASGGTIEHFGMPMDPGNLLLLGRLGSSIVIGMPGCARSIIENGVDKVLDRLSCGLPVNREWITALGVGGLLKEIVDRPRPRVIAQEQSRVSSLLLCAGTSSRFGDANKLLANWQGAPMIHQAIKSVVASKVVNTTLVTGHQHAQVKQATEELSGTQNFQYLHNDAYTTGMASSLKKGISALIESDAIVVCLADMPLVTNEVIDTLIETFIRYPDKALYIPTYHGRRGNPVLIARSLFDSVLTLEGDKGARVLAKRFPATVMEVPTECAGILQDFDTEADFYNKQ